MKKTLSIFTSLASIGLVLSMSVHAQDSQLLDTIVSKQPQNRTVLMEEYTGMGCGYCPAGHAISNQLKQQYGDSLIVVNLHAPASSLVNPTAGQPDMRTDYGDALASNAGVATLPQATLNRHGFGGTMAFGRDQWASLVEQAHALPAYLNVAARADIDWPSRELSVQVQIYYTAQASVDENHIHIAVLQDDIIGYQKNGYQTPEQYLGDDQYAHQHILRDLLTGQWGEAVPAGDSGSFLSKTCTETLPDAIRNVDLDLLDLQIVVFVSEDRNEVINACYAPIHYNNGPDYIFGLAQGTQQDVYSCDDNIEVSFLFENRNIDDPDIESVEFLLTSRDQAHPFTWQPDSAFRYGDAVQVVSDEFPLQRSGQADEVEVSVSKVNGEPYDFEGQKTLSIPVIKYLARAPSDSVVLDLWQDGFGTETTWTLADNGTGRLVAEGGPYEDIALSLAPMQHTCALPVAEGCYRFTLRDSRGDGINNIFGEGHFSFLDTEGNTLLEHDGVFTDSVVVMLRRSGVGNEARTAAGLLKASLYPNPATDYCYLTVESPEGQQAGIEIFSLSGQKLFRMGHPLQSGIQTIEIPLKGLRSGLYLVRLGTDSGTSTLRLVVNR